MRRLSNSLILLSFILTGLALYQTSTAQPTLVNQLDIRVGTQYNILNVNRTLYPPLTIDQIPTYKLKVKPSLKIGYKIPVLYKFDFIPSIGYANYGSQLYESAKQSKSIFTLSAIRLGVEAVYNIGPWSLGPTFVTNYHLRVKQKEYEKSVQKEWTLEMQTENEGRNWSFFAGSSIHYKLNQHLSLVLENLVSIHPTTFYFVNDKTGAPTHFDVEDLPQEKSVTRVFSTSLQLKYQF